MNSTIFIIKEILTQRHARATQRFSRQQERLETLLNSMLKNLENIEQMEYALDMLERFCNEKREPRVIPRSEVKDFFAYASYVYDRLQSRWHIHLNYYYFCCMLCTRYLFERRSGTGERRFLGFISVLSYFKRERGR